MREGQPSRTAARVAIRRAAHQVLDQPLIFPDPFAMRIIGAEARARLEADPGSFNRGRFVRVLRAFLAVRSLIAEDALAVSVASGTKQYVVLGAGLDTFALRNRNSELRVFEVDHPDSQIWKRRRLREVGIPEPATATFVPVDFGRQELGVELLHAGFLPDRPAFFSWLGVTPYLEADAVWKTLEFVATAVGKEGGITFDYGARPGPFQFFQKYIYRRLAKRVALLGEPFKTAFRPAELAEGLIRIGLGNIQDLGNAELNRKYFSDRRDGMVVGGMGHVVTARRSA
ncbi:MAG TPA: class I SAM-dependent methyltransferase [Gemmatimonadales bacterium]|jgi:methyltransferase (TIGR00027 family)